MPQNMQNLLRLRLWKAYYKGEKDPMEVESPGRKPQIINFNIGLDFVSLAFSKHQNHLWKFLKQTHQSLNIEIPAQ